MRKLKLGLSMLLAAAAICALPVLAFAKDGDVEVCGVNSAGGTSGDVWLFNDDGTFKEHKTGTSTGAAANYVIYDGNDTITLKGTLDVSEAGNVEGGIDINLSYANILVDGNVTVATKGSCNRKDSPFILRTPKTGDNNYTIKPATEGAASALTIRNDYVEGSDDGEPCCISMLADEKTGKFGKLFVEGLDEFTAVSSIVSDFSDPVNGIDASMVSFENVGKVQVQAQAKKSDGTAGSKSVTGIKTDGDAVYFTDCDEVKIEAGAAIQGGESYGLWCAGLKIENSNVTATAGQAPGKEKGTDASVGIIAICEEAEGADGKVTLLDESSSLSANGYYMAVFAKGFVAPDSTTLLGSTDIAVEPTDGNVTWTSFTTDLGEMKMAVIGENYVKRLATKLPKTALERVAGADRYETGAEAADEAVAALGTNWKKVVVLVTGENYPDALCANAVAGEMGGVIVPTTGASLNAYAKAEIEKLQPTKIVVVGGTSSVSDAAAEAAVEAAEPEAGTGSLAAGGAESEGCELVRYAGEDRYGTCADILEKVFNESAGFIVASGATSADVLSAASYSYNQTTPVVLVDGTGTIPQVVADALAKNEGGAESAILLGGDARVSDDVYAQLGLDESECVRLAGKDRYETARAFADFAMTGKVLTAANAGFAAGADAKFSDALCAGPLCGANGSIMLLVDDPENEAFRTYVSGIKSGIQKGYVFGGTETIPDFEL